MKMPPTPPQEAVRAALARLSSMRATQELSLEEIMMCSYEMPCVRVSESWHSRFKRGSVLVFKDRVIIVANPEDNTLNMNMYVGARRVRFIAYQREYGVQPKSRFYTQQLYVIVLEDIEEIREQREKLRALVSKPPIVMRKGNGFFESNSAGGLNIPRCPEESGLRGRLEASRLRRVLAEGAD